MTPIETIHLQGPLGAAELWPRVAREVQAWLQRQQLPARDAVLLLPFSALLAPARAALAALGGWQPRVETALTLAASLGPPPAAEPLACQGDTTPDRLAAAALLRGQAWGAAWEARDPPGFARVVALVVDAAQVLRDAALAHAPHLREAFWAHARQAITTAAGPAATEASLLRVALEWAAAAAPGATGRLFEHPVSAWMTLQIGGADAQAEALLGHREVPSLRLVADPDADEPWAEVAAHANLERWLCDDLEAEARAAAGAVIDALNAGRTPVALVALDRGSLRRIRALLERAGVALLDETGWLLATTRAAASVVALLRAALPEAGPDARLDWLKTWSLAPAAAVDALEAHWRGRRKMPQHETGLRLWEEAQEHLAPLAAPGRRTLAAWLDTLQGLLARDGGFDTMSADPAGAQVLAALGWLGAAPWRPAAEQLRLDLAGFIAWVETTLEAAPYLPPPDEGAQVVLTPLARAFGRPFGEVVVPGADATHLGAGDAAPSLIGTALAVELGLDHEAARRQRQRLAFAQLLAQPRVTLLRRHRDGDEPLAESPEVEWLLRARARSGAPAWPLRRWMPPSSPVRPAPVQPPLPVAGDALPTVLSASQLEALRQCPYRFFARAVLRLDEPQELEAALAKRDYGNWLHAALHHFHSQRDLAAAPLPQLLAAADAATQELELDEAELLPFRASFEHFVPAYLAWLAEREEQGWFWSDGESDHRIEPPAWPGVTLRGRIDRLDHGPGEASQLIDYKTGSADALARKVKTPLEDTQLAFYAALLGADEAFRACYLALDDAKAPREIEHDGVQRTAAEMLEHLADEWQRLQGGEAMQALGEAPICDHCEARGLCRRDHWSGTR